MNIVRINRAFYTIWNGFLRVKIRGLFEDKFNKFYLGKNLKKYHWFCIIIMSKLTNLLKKLSNKLIKMFFFFFCIKRTRKNKMCEKLKTSTFVRVARIKSCEIN